MAFGLCNAPSTFARLMELVLKGLHWKICLIYLDDKIVMGRTFEEELEWLQQVFERLAWAGLKLKPKMCFLSPETGFVPGTCGHRRRYQRRPWKGGTSPHFAHPRKQHRGQKLGLASYYRRFLPDFSTVAQPLYKLTEAKTEFVWTGECQLAFDSLKGSLTSARVLAYPTREGTSRHRRIRPWNWCSVNHSFKMGWKNLLHLQVEHCLSPKGTIVRLVLSSWQSLSLSSNIGVTCKVQDSAFELIVPPCVLSLKLRIQNDNWHVGLNS